MSKLKEIWARLSPSQKRMATISITAVALMVFGTMGFKAKQSKKTEKAPTRNLEEIKLDEDQLEKGLFSQAKEVQDLQDQQLKIQDERIQKSEKQMETILKNLDELKVAATTKPVGEANKDKDVSKSFEKSYPLPPAPAPAAHMGQTPTNSYTSSSPPPLPKAEAKFAGEISVVKNESFKAEETGDKKKTENNEIYLPPSFMEANLLSGVTAPTTTAGKNDPLPLLFRVRDLAVLPNAVKANLKGCFVLGEGQGKLSDERVHVRLNTLSCVARNGSAVIDQPVKGWVTDSDGRIGLAGNVVAKMGVHLARSALAGFIGGIGDGMETSSKASSFNATGQPTEIFTNTETHNILKSGIGSGISKSADELQKFYLELASQTLPVIEVGPTKNITLIISEGLTLKIKDYKEDKCVLK